jgi:hypothetical protein
MFWNLQLFDELNPREIVSALKAVLMEEKALVLLLPERNNLKLIPVESDTSWEGRTSDILEPLKVSVEGFKGWGAAMPNPFTKWLYQREELQKLLNLYDYKPGLFWVCNASELAIDAISRISPKLITESVYDLSEISVQVDHLTDKKGTKLEALDTATFFSADKKDIATEIKGCRVPVKSLGVADPVTSAATHTIEPKTFPTITPISDSQASMENLIHTPEIEAILNSKGADPLTRELRNYVIQRGLYGSDCLDFLNTDAFIAHLNSSVSFEVSRGTIIYQYSNGEHNRLERASLRQRIYRLRKALMNVIQSLT